MKNVLNLQTVRVLALACVTVGSVGVNSALATFIRDPVTLDRTSPSVVSGKVDPSDILGTVSNPGQGDPLIHISAGNYGIIAGTGNNTLDISNGEVEADVQQYFFFTVDRDSKGIGGSALRAQTDALIPSASDQFKARLSISPASAATHGTQATVTEPTKLDLNEDVYNLQPDDNADSLELIQFKAAELTADRDVPVYFTLDAASPVLTAQGWKASDILLAVPPAQVKGNVKAISVFADHTTMNLLETDVVDGLAVWDGDGMVDPDHGTDLAIFSLAPGSPSLLTDPADPLSAPLYSPADVFITSFGGGFSLYVDHLELGLNMDDNIDGLDVQSVPEPTTLAVLLVPAMAMLGRRRRAV